MHNRKPDPTTFHTTFQERFPTSGNDRIGFTDGLIIKLIFITLLFLALSNEAFSDDFDMRLAAGNKALSSPEGQTYELSISPAIQSAMVKCLPPGSQYTGQFALIGNVLRSGKIASVEVRPIDDISQCFAERIKESALPVPPLSSEGVEAFPITIEMNIIP